MQPFKHGHADNCELETMGAGWSNYVYVSCKDNATCEGKLNFFDTTFEAKISQSEQTLAAVAAKIAYMSNTFRIKMYKKKNSNKKTKTKI